MKRRAWRSRLCFWILCKHGFKYLRFKSHQSRDGELRFGWQMKRQTSVWNPPICEREGYISSSQIKAMSTNQACNWFTCLEELFQSHRPYSLSLCHVIGLWNPDLEIAFGKLYVSSDNRMLWEKKVTVMHNVLYVSMLVNQTYFYNASYKVHSIKVRLIKELHSLAFCFTVALLNMLRWIWFYDHSLCRLAFF